jgi:Serine dehydrogenase proteinase
MSAGTMIALSTKEILMGLYSNLGPIDPQVGNGAAAHAILEEFKEIKRTYADSPKEAPAWVPILQKYTPTLIGACEKAIQLSETMVGSWLETNMFSDSADPHAMAARVVEALGSHKKTLSHGRHINIEEARKLGLNIRALEDDKDLQNAVLSVHHCYTVTLSLTPTAAIIENHLGMRFINFMAVAPQMPQIVLGPQPMQAVDENRTH